MSGKSGGAGQAISLPQGGGALHGIGEKFSPDLQTGTGNFSVPIAVPPGRNGFQPQLNLAYSTGSGNGPFGAGWSLSVPGVSRKTSAGVPQYDDVLDTFLLSGAEDLVPISRDAAGWVHYQPRTEGLFARIRYLHKGQNSYWEVQSKDGLVSLYGTPKSAGAVPGTSAGANVDPAVLANPLIPADVFAWHLTSTTDPFGNRIEYLYERDPVRTDGPRQWDQVYLAEIRYMDYGDLASPTFLASIKFHYEDRPDPFSHYRSGFEIRTVQRCSHIEVFTRPEAEVLTRTYHLRYLDLQAKAGPLPANGISLLQQIEVEGHDGAVSEWLPPLEFGYTRFEPKQRRFAPVTGPDMPPMSLAHPSFELVDLQGNGLPDILEMDDTVRYWRNLGDSRFDRPRPMPTAPAGIGLAAPGVQLIDADGDGRLDLLVTTPQISGYFPTRFGGTWDGKSFQRYRTAPSFDLKDPEVKMVDLDGDGVTDAIRSGSRLECFFNDPQQGWNTTRQFVRKALEVFPNVNFSDPRVHWADLSGDGMQDIVLVYNGHVEYWPNLGYGNWGKRLSMRNAPRFPYGYDPRRILIGDVDGDGVADLVYVDDTKVTLWINQTGNAWSDPITILGTPPVSDIDAIRLADVGGNGVSGVLWSANFGDLSRDHMFFLDFTGGVKPYVLNEMDNHLGALTRIEYAPSTRFYLQDEQRPETRWKTPLPFPVQVVARVEVIDALSRGKLTTEYQYHHGYWDGAEREFRGFGRVDHRDTEVFADFHAEGLHPDRPFDPVAARSFSPPTETRTWFHLGPVGDAFGAWEEADFSGEFWPGDLQALTRPRVMTDLLKALPRRVKRDALRALRGSVVRSELYGLDGTDRANRPYTVTESLQGVREESPPGPGAEDRRHLFFPHALAQRTTQWERGGDPMTQLTFTGDYDAYGQALSQVTIAVPRGRDFRVAAAAQEPYLATYAVTTYGKPDDPLRYLVNRTIRTTSYEVLNDGSTSAYSLRDDTFGGAATLRLFGQTRSFYDGLEFQGLPFGRIGDYGVVTRTESLVLTEEILQDAYRSGDAILSPAEAPPYLASGGTPPWTAEYPSEFRSLLPALAGYLFYPGGPDPEDARGYFVTTSSRYDFQESSGSGRGLVTTQRDALGRDTLVRYDPFDLFPVEVTDPALLKTTAQYDYRVLQPVEVTDINGNRTAFVFTPLGLLASSAAMGKIGESVGDTLLVPGTRLVYDFLAYTDPQRREPISVQTIKRVHYVNDLEVPLSERDETIESREYSDGFGRLLQARAQAEDITFGDPVFGADILPADQTARAGDAIGRQRAPGDPINVVVSGWQVYDNKGQVVEKYEPFYSTGWDYAAPTDAERGQKIVMYYDPRGHAVRTVNPDGSEQRVLFGVPGRIAMPDVTNPDVYEPTPWEAFTYDANDNAGRTHPVASAAYQSHWNTPASIVVDALGRTIKAVERNGSNPVTDWYVTRSTYDIQGNLVVVTDALGRAAFRHVYDLAKHALRIESIDAGIRRSVLDAVGGGIESRDSKGALLLHSYDILNRPIRLWARDGTNQALTLRERSVYGDASDAGMTRQQAADRNLLGKLYRHYDEAGRLTLEQSDFKGNVLEKVREVISDAAILTVFTPRPANWQVSAFRVDWQPPAGGVLETYALTLLDAASYRTSVTYDGLDRVRTMLYPQDVTGSRKELLPQYNRAGALERVVLDGAIYVAHIAYNAKGQRSLIAYGNNVMTRHAYDPQTFRLSRMRTEPYADLDALTYRADGAALQDFAYVYDLVGNITRIKDRTPGSGIPGTPLGTEALDRAFTYEPIYRLSTATGRECDIPNSMPWDDNPRCTDLTLTRPYNETYLYDPVGNFTVLGHSGSPTRNFTLVNGTNRLATVAMGTTDVSYLYDVNGNMVQENTERHFEWDYSDHMRVYRTQPGESEPSVHAHYLYDSGGQRIKKLVRKQGGQVEVTVYIDGLFEYQRIVQGSTVQENNTLHVMDSQSRIALVRVGNAFTDDPMPPVKYYLGDHLGSSNVVLNTSGDLLNREEYTPYGETSFGSFARKRYRFTGKERDEESGLYYHGARYYAPWFVRWVSCDPSGISAGINLFRYVQGNPLRFTDRFGLAENDTVQPTEREKGAGMSSESLRSFGPPKPPPSPNTSNVPNEGNSPNSSSTHTPAPPTGFEVSVQKAIGGETGPAAWQGSSPTFYEQVTAPERRLESNARAHPAFAGTIYGKAREDVFVTLIAPALIPGGPEEEIGAAAVAEITEEGAAFFRSVAPYFDAPAVEGTATIKFGEGAPTFGYNRNPPPSLSYPTVPTRLPRGKVVGASPGGQLVSSGTNGTQAYDMWTFHNENGTPFLAHGRDAFFGRMEGSYNATHVEPQLLYQNPGLDFYEVNAKQCRSCLSRTSEAAVSCDVTITTLSPEGFRWFTPLGSFW